ECRERVERALANVDPDAARGARSDMQLFAALGAARMYTQPPGPEVREAWTRALELAERLEDTDYQLRALWGIWSAQLNTGEFRAALATAEQFGKVAETSSDPLDRAVGDRLIGGALHIVGDLAGARARTESMLRGVAAPQRSHLSRFVVDQRLMARNTLAGVLWLQGLRDQAAALSVANLEEARATDHALTVCSILSDSICPIALLNGDFAAAERYAKLLVELTAAHSLELWSVWARCFNGALVARRLEGADALGVLHGSLEDLLRAQLQPRYMTLLADLAESLGRAGDAPVGLAAIEDALARCEASEERWCFAELLRVKGELLQAQGGRGAMREAEQTLREARDWARKLGSLSWELRSALSLARLRPDGARARDAREGLGSVYGRFAEGFGTSDLVAARGLLDQLN
ncbi:MAG TPA: transcriptional regulator, partial [Myxococcota bacterium]|nr:transcriptional regulator [Myxococcota bacterium]